MKEEMHCFNKNNFRPLDHSVILQYNTIKVQTRKQKKVLRRRV